MANVYRRSYIDQKTGKKKKTAKYYGKYVDGDGILHRLPLSTNKAAAEMMLAELKRKAEFERAGIRDPLKEHRKTPLAEHLSAWLTSLRANRRGEEYIDLKESRVIGILDGCGWVNTSDLSADRLETFLQELRVQGRSVQTSNDWLQAIRQFVRWMAIGGRIERDPFQRVKGGNVRTDVRRRRGELTPAEVDKLLEATTRSETTFRGLSGIERAVIYRVALGTGFRVKELAALEPESFEFTTDPPTASLPAKVTKNRHGVTQPLPEGLSVEVAHFLASRPARMPLWPGTWSDRSADMLKADLATAGVPVVVNGLEGDEVRDFHALRNTFISNVIRAGADIKQAMTLARHSDPKLTAGRYARTRLYDLGAVVNKLPTSKSEDNLNESSRIVLRKTGTEDGTTGPATGPKLAQTPDRPRLRLITDEETAASVHEDDEKEKPRDFSGFDSDCGPMMTTEAERAGFEPAVQCYSHAALAKRCFRPLSHLSVDEILSLDYDSDKHALKNRTPCSISWKRSAWVPTSRSMQSGPW